jgi:hypothetical protein
VTNLKRYFAANLMPTPSTTAFVERLTTALLQQHGLEVFALIGRRPYGYRGVGTQKISSDILD